MLFGQTQELPASRFIGEIDAQYIDTIGSARRTLMEDSGTVRSAASTPFGAKSGTQPAHVFAYSGSSSSQRTPTGSASENAGNDHFLTPDTIAKGMEVLHPRFGKGTVVTVEKVAGDALVSVAFDNRTTKNMLVRQAKLTRA